MNLSTTITEAPEIVLKGDSIAKRASFDFVRYANCWEDADVLVEAMSPRYPFPSRFLSIASAGDNTLALLSLDPELVVAVDLSSAQLACLEIRMAAFAELTYADMLGFLGFRSPLYDRVEIYNALRPSLCASARSFWGANPNSIKNGLIHDGKFERYLRFFGRRLLPLIHSKRLIEEVRQEKGLQERIDFYDTRWNNRRWRGLFKLFFSRWVMGRSGRDPEFLRYVKGSVAERILERARYGLTCLPTHDNPYLEYILTGQFERSLPYYAREEHFERIRRNLDKLHLFHGTTDETLASFDAPFDGFNLSDIFEYMDEELFRRTTENLLDHALPGARLAYWNMLAPRRISALFPDRVRCMTSRSEDLFRRNKAFFYQAFFLDEVIQ